MAMDALSTPGMPPKGYGPQTPKKRTGLWLLWILTLLIFGIGGFLAGFKIREQRSNAELEEINNKAKQGLEELEARLDSIKLVKIRVYFAKDDKLAPLERRVLEEAGKTAEKLSMDELLAGPSDEERQLGVTTYIPKDTTLVNFSLESGKAVVTFSKELAKTPKNRTSLVREQIEKTLSEFEDVSEVQIKIEGVSDDQVLAVEKTNG